MAFGDNTSSWLNAIDLSQPNLTMRLYDVWSGRVATTSIRTSMGTSPTGQLIEMPNTALYTSMPLGAKCVFSIAGQEDRKPRSMRHILPTRTIAVWSNHRVQAHANKFRAACPEEADAVARPTEWEHLFDYFDASDLWYFGAWNLWAVVRRLCDENEAKKAGDSWDPRMPAIVDDWVYRWLTHSAHRGSLASWDKQSDILTVLKKSDWEELGGCRPGVLDLVRAGLVKWFVFYHGGKVQENLTPEVIVQENAEDDKAENDEKDGKAGKPADGKQAQFATGQLAEGDKISDDTRSNFDSSENRAHSSKAGSAFLAVPAPGNQRSISAPSSVVGDIQAPQDDIGNPVIGDPPLGASVGEGTAIRNVIVATNKFTHEVTIRYPKPKKVVPAKAIRQYQQKSSTLEPVPMNTKAEPVMQKPKKAGKKAKEPTTQVANGQNQATKNPQNSQVAHLPDPSSDFMSAETQPVPSYHNSGPSTSRPPPMTCQAQRPKAGSTDMNEGHPNNLRSKRVNGLSTSPPQRENGDVRYMYNKSGPVRRHFEPSRQYPKSAPPPDCLNSDKDGVVGEGLYVDCGCIRCKERSRSVFVPRFGGNESPQEKLENLSEIFGAFGTIERITNTQGLLMRFWIVFESEESAVAAVDALSRTLCKFGNRPLVVSHPFFSKYFVPMPSKGHGSGCMATGANARRHSTESSQARQSGSAENRKSPAYLQGQKHIPLPRPMEDHRNKETQCIPRHHNQSTVAGQAPQSNTANASHLMANPSIKANLNPIPCPPISTQAHKVQPSLGSPLNIVSRMPPDPFVSQPNPSTAPSYNQAFQHGPAQALGPHPGSARRNPGNMARHRVRDFSGSTDGSNRPHHSPYTPCPEVPVSIQQTPQYQGCPVPVFQPFYQVPFQAPPIQGQPMSHPGSHMHQTVHPGVPPMVVPGPQLFNPYMNPVGYGPGNAENCPPLAQDLQQMHSVHPQAPPIWYNQAQLPYAPWGMPMPPFQGHPHHSMPGPCFPPVANGSLVCPPPPQFRGALPSISHVPEVLSNSTKASTPQAVNQLESEMTRVRLPSTPPEATSEVVDQCIKLDSQPVPNGLGGFKTSEEDAVPADPQDPKKGEEFTSNDAPSPLSEVQMEQHADQVHPVIDNKTPSAVEEGLVVVGDSEPACQASASDGSAAKEAVGSEEEIGESEAAVRENQDQLRGLAESPSPPSSEASLPREIQPAGHPQFSSQDIRLDPEFQARMGTAIRRKPEHKNRLSSQWMSHNSNGYTQLPSFGKHQCPFGDPPESPNYPAVVDYNDPFPYHGFQSPPVPPPMESSAEIHNFLYGGLFPHPPLFGPQAGENELTARKLNPVYDQHYGENGQLAKSKGGVGTRPPTPSFPTEGGVDLPTHGSNTRAQSDAAGPAGSKLGGVNHDDTGTAVRETGVEKTTGAKTANMAAETTATDTQQKGKKNKPNKGSQLLQGVAKPLEGSANSGDNELAEEMRVQPKPELQHVETPGVSNLQTTLQGTEEKLGTVRVNKKTRGKGGVSHLESLFVPGNEKTKTSAVQTEATTRTEKTSSKQESNVHGSFKGLSKSFDPWPRPPTVFSPHNMKATLPKVITRSHKRENLVPAVLADAPLTGTSETFFSAVSRLSSRENSPHSGDEGTSVAKTEAGPQRQGNPQIAPIEVAPTSVAAPDVNNPSAATLNGDWSPPLPSSGQPKRAENKVSSGARMISEASLAPTNKTATVPVSEPQTNGTKSKPNRKKNKKKQHPPQNEVGDEA
ncbi:hypothetical protein B0T14DRAFT_491351 [Immersiella caudata]|uniref:RRM domain-containing protein n=1 Tax=Immersiella caudata TaxID=314043 RepID=A0AA40CC88_9PEZI|nr:hypothetical protein B0T14DRAFT_491351 [Immersiella caudata]